MASSYLFGIPRMPRVQQNELIHVDGAIAVHIRPQDKGVRRSLGLGYEIQTFKTLI